MYTIGLYLVVGAALATGILLLKTPFFSLAKKSVALLDVLISDVDEDEKLDALSKQISQTMLSLLVMLGLLVVVLGLSWAIWYAGQFLFSTALDAESTSFGRYYMLPFAIGSLLPFLRKSRSTSAYSDLAQLFHHLVLDNYHIGRALLKKQIKGVNAPDATKTNGIIITGLARAGTTALTRELAARGPFSSLDYSNMPVLMAPRLWAKLYKPKKVEDQERAHGDGIKVGLASVEALEEYFFKVVLNDRYIGEEGVLEHELAPEENELYRKYQESIRRDNHLYLAKNNNGITRYRSLTAQNPDLHVYIMLRDPLQHAFSLMKQHLKFEKEQEQDPFILTYMEWLGHHEFGKGQKPFVLENAPKAPYKGDTYSLNYWLERWISYYAYVLSLNNVRLISYDVFLNRPEEVLTRIGAEAGVVINVEGIALFDKVAADLPEYDQELAQKAYELFHKLEKQIPHQQ